MNKKIINKFIIGLYLILNAGHVSHAQDEFITRVSRLGINLGSSASSLGAHSPSPYSPYGRGTGSSASSHAAHAPSSNGTYGRGFAQSPSRPVSVPSSKAESRYIQDYLMLGNFSEEDKKRMRGCIEFAGAFEILNKAGGKKFIYWVEHEHNLHASLLTLQAKTTSQDRDSQAEFMADFCKGACLKSGILQQSYTMCGYDVRLLAQGHEYSLYGSSKENGPKRINTIHKLPAYVKQTPGCKPLMQIAIAVRLSSNRFGKVAEGPAVEDIEQCKTTLKQMLNEEKVSDKFGRFKGHVTLAFLRKYPYSQENLSILRGKRDANFKQFCIDTQKPFEAEDMDAVKCAYLELESRFKPVESLTMGDYSLSYRYPGGQKEAKLSDFS